MKRFSTIIVTTTATMVILAHGSVAQAFGGHGLAGHGGGERIVSSQVVSDVAVGETYSGDVGGESIVEGGAMGGVQNRQYGNPDLFYNYYTQGGANSANAQMYVSPVPTPRNVGHTYNTYQPFYPHELLYWHQDTFHNYYDNGRGMNRTRATYYSPPVRQTVSNFYWNVLRIPR